MNYIIDTEIWNNNLIAETKLHTELELALQRIRNLESQLDTQNRINDDLRNENSKIRSQRDRITKSNTDRITELLNGISSTEKVIIRKSGLVSIRDGKSERHSGNLISCAKEIVPLKSNKPVAEAYKIGFISFREFKTNTRKAKDPNKKFQIKFWEAYKSLFQLFLLQELDTMIEKFPQLDAEYIMEHPSECFLSNKILDEESPLGDYYFINLDDGSRAYFAVVAGNAVPTYIQEPDGTMTFPPK